MKTILFIEDNVEMLENLAEYFELEGFHTLKANNGKEGIALAGKFIPDLIICDVIMTEMNGHEVLQLLLSKLKTASIPFIFSTSNSEVVQRSEALALGADDYIVKPFELDTLLMMSKKWIASGSERPSTSPFN